MSAPEGPLLTSEMVAEILHLVPSSVRRLSSRDLMLSVLRPYGPNGRTRLGFRLEDVEDYQQWRYQVDNAYDLRRAYVRSLRPTIGN